MLVTAVSEAPIAGIDTATGRTRNRAFARGASIMPTATTAHQHTAVSPSRAAAIGALHREHTQFRVPRAARLVKDIVWLAVVSMALAVLAILAGLIDIFIEADLVPLVLGTGLASLTFSVLGLTDRLTGHS